MSDRSTQPPVRPNLVLAICCMSLFLVVIDVTVVNVSLPAIQHELQASLSGLQWILDAYTLVVASLLMLAGSLSDRFGRRKTFQLGLSLFTAGSLLCSLAHSTGQLIGFRAVQGLGASMLNPVALSIVVNVFKEPKDRARAVGVWGAVSGIALALGPLVGGVLTQTVGWRSIFWVNVPVGIAAVLLAAFYIPESKAEVARPIDPGGQVLIFVFLTALTYGVIDGPHAGWASPPILGMFLLAALALAGFLLYEPRLKQPLVDLRFFRSVPFSSATVLGLCAFSSFAGFLFLNALYLEQARHLSAFATGLCTLPLALAMAATSPISGRLMGMHGTRPSLLISGIGFIASTLILTQLRPETPMPLLLGAYTLFGVGLGMVNPAIANTAVSGMPLAQAGVAAAIASTGRQVGAALGVAIAGTVVYASRRAGTEFARATHPIWWIMTGCGVVVLVLGWVSNGAWAQASTARVKALLG